MQLSLWQIALLAVVQGATEFLPVSSSGHLVVLAALFSPDGTTRGLDIADVNIVLHGGTLLSILVYYSHRVWRLLGEDRRTVGLLVVGTIPAGIIGVPVKEFASESILGNPLLVGFLLPITGLLLIWASRAKVGSTTYPQMSYWHAFLIGISQAAAILPGLSRSGATISTGLRLGLSRDAAAAFSFLLAIPVIGGACLLEVLTLLGQATFVTPPSYLALGALISFLVGLLSLLWLIRLLERGKLHYFACWCIPLGMAVVVWQLWT
ncbi:MAG: undecaprenyl-diphosphate phosphatase [Pirellulaceae bacterium]